MGKIVSATEAKNRFDALLGEVIETNKPIFIERRGKIQGVLMSEDQYRGLLILEWEQQRVEAIRRLEEIEMQVAVRGDDDLTEDEAKEIGVQAVREVRADRAIERLKERSAQGEN
jgi:PHD/YefM family antitoxin component YafN of YafNO toxin-antitoxin module